MHNNDFFRSQLLRLLELTSVIHDGTLSSIVTATQKAWLRTAGQERWDMRDTVDYEKNREQLLALLASLGMVHAIALQRTQYDYAIVFGGTIKRMQKRLAYLYQLWNQGVRFQEIVFLCGQRPLDMYEEPVSLLSDSSISGLPMHDDLQLPAYFPAHETAAMKFLYAASVKPDEFEVSELWVDVPMKQAADGLLVRPTTADTIHAWLATDPKVGSCLAITTQPRVLDQDAVLRMLMPDVWYVETVASHADDDEKIVVYLDSLARYLYCLQNDKSS